MDDNADKGTPKEEAKDEQMSLEQFAKSMSEDKDSNVSQADHGEADYYKEIIEPKFHVLNEDGSLNVKETISKQAKSYSEAQKKLSRQDNVIKKQDEKLAQAREEFNRKHFAEKITPKQDAKEIAEEDYYRMITDNPKEFVQTLKEQVRAELSAEKEKIQAAASEETQLFVREVEDWFSRNDKAQSYQDDIGQYLADMSVNNPKEAERLFKQDVDSMLESLYYKIAYEKTLAGSKYIPNPPKMEGGGIPPAKAAMVYKPKDAVQAAIQKSFGFSDEEMAKLEKGE